MFQFRKHQVTGGVKKLRLGQSVAVLLIIEIHENHEIHEIHMTKKRNPRNPA